MGFSGGVSEQRALVLYNKVDDARFGKPWTKKHPIRPLPEIGCFCGQLPRLLQECSQRIAVFI